MILLIIICVVFFLGLWVSSALLARSEQQRIDLEFNLEMEQDTARSIAESYRDERLSHDATRKDFSAMLSTINHNNKVIDNLQKTLKAYRTE